MEERDNQINGKNPRLLLWLALILATLSFVSTMEDKCSACNTIAEEIQIGLSNEKPKNHLDMRHRLDSKGQRRGKVIDYSTYGIQTWKYRFLVGYLDLSPYVVKGAKRTEAQRALEPRRRRALRHARRKNGGGGALACAPDASCARLDNTNSRTVTRSQSGYHNNLVSEPNTDALLSGTYRDALRSTRPLSSAAPLASTAVRLLPSPFVTVPQSTSMDEGGPSLNQLMDMFQGMLHDQNVKMDALNALLDALQGTPPAPLLDNVASPTASLVNTAFSRPDDTHSPRTLRTDFPIYEGRETLFRG
ncbi:hypothetical protein KSP39_PZI021668 [Platanthera zijinensis]|uniref:DUF3456 domain-containing protein n=1 Tax=Platanthera zijinensis TaxID=2320716 RepID=A0AAP0FW09_9ASPA